MVRAAGMRAEKELSAAELLIRAYGVAPQRTQILVALRACIASHDADTQATPHHGGQVLTVGGGEGFLARGLESQDYQPVWTQRTLSRRRLNVAYQRQAVIEDRAGDDEVGGNRSFDRQSEERFVSPETSR